MDLTVDRRAFSVSSLTDQTHDRDYWLRQPAQSRFVAIETQRRIVYGSTRATARLQRVFEAAERAPR